MNKAIESLPRIIELDIHVGEIAMRSLSRVIQAWNDGIQENEAKAIAALVDCVRDCERAKIELLEAGYNNLAYLFGQLGMVCGSAIKHRQRLLGIGGSLNINLKKIDENPHWLSH